MHSFSNVWKKYGNKDAVKGLNLALKANECFGLLGSNGAGKTTTFKMLTGDIKNTTGDIYVCGVNVNNNREKVLSVYLLAANCDFTVYGMFPDSRSRRLLSTV